MHRTTAPGLSELSLSPSNVVSNRRSPRPGGPAHRQPRHLCTCERRPSFATLRRSAARGGTGAGRQRRARKRTSLDWQSALTSSAVHHHRTTVLLLPYICNTFLMVEVTGPSWMRPEQTCFPLHPVEPVSRNRGPIVTPSWARASQLHTPKAMGGDWEVSSCTEARDAVHNRDNYRKRRRAA